MHDADTGVDPMQALVIGDIYDVVTRTAVLV